MKNYFLLCCLLAILFGCKKEAVGTDSKTSPTSNTSTPKIKTITTTSYEYIKSINSNDTICEPTGETSTTNFEYDTKGRITKINTIINFENTSSINTLTFNYTSSSTVLLQCFVDNNHYYDSQLSLDEYGYVKHIKTNMNVDDEQFPDSIYYNKDGILLFGGKEMNSNSIIEGNLTKFKSFLSNNISCEFDKTKNALLNDISIFPFIDITPSLAGFVKYKDFKYKTQSFSYNKSHIKNFIFLTELFGKPNKNVLLNIESDSFRNESLCEFDTNQQLVKRTIITLIKNLNPSESSKNIKIHKEIINYSYTN